MDQDQEERLVARVGHRPYGLLVRLRLRDQNEPMRADDLVTPEDGRVSTMNALQALERAGLLTREATFIPDRGKIVLYRTHVENDSLRSENG